MITPASRLFLAAAVFGLLAGISHAAGSGTELYGVSVLGAVFVAGLFLGVVAIVHRDTDPPPGPDEAAGATAEDLAPGPMPTQPSPWPLLCAVGAGMVAVGVAAGPGYFMAGLALLVIAGAEWGVQAWSEKLTADPDRNRALRSRIMLPFEIPVGVALGGAATAILLSRVLLAVSEIGAVVVAGVVATVVLIIGSVVALRPRIPQAALTTLAVVGGLSVIGAGIGGAVAGEREFHHEDVHPTEEGEPSDDRGLSGHQCTDDAVLDPECPADRSDEEAPADADAPATGDEEGRAAVSLVAREFSFTPAAPGADAGPVEISYENAGTVSHTLLIEGDEDFLIEVEPGQTATETVDLDTGEYVLYCRIADYRERGMEGLLIVQ